VNEDAARRWCLEELAGRKVVAALPPLIELAATAAKAQWPETLEGYLPEFQSEVHRAMLGATHSNNPQTRFFALRFGPQKAPGEAWASRAMERLKDDPDAGVKNVAGVAAAELGLIDAIPLLEAAQNLNALEIFANQENNDAIRAILNILESENCPHEAYLVAGRLKLRDAAPLIVEKLLTSDWFFRREEVVAVLAQIDPAMGTPLRVAALEMSDSRKEKESIELLLKEPVPDDAETRNFVAHAVVRKILNRTSLQDKLMPLVERWNTPETTDFLLGEYPTAPPEQRSAILWMLLTVKHSQVAEMILVEYETNRFLVRNHLKHIVPEAEEAALKMLFDKDDEVAKRGCDLLEEIGTKKALVSLNAVAKNKRRSTQIQWAAESAARTILRRVHEEERRQERDKRIDRK
jgi:HEAT repeat protein